MAGGGGEVGAGAVEILGADAEVGDDVEEGGCGDVLAITEGGGSEVGEVEDACLGVGCGKEKAG